MKKIKRNRYIFLIAMLIAITILPNVLIAQKEEVQDLKVFSATELKSKFDTFSKDDGFKKLLADANKKGFGKIEDTKEDTYSWGFSGKHMVDKKLNDVVICMYDFINKEGENCAMLWCKIGDKTYKCYTVFPQGKDGLDFLAQGKEWYVDGKNNIQLAHSFFSCLANKLETNCHTVCTTSDKNCINLAKVTKRSTYYIFGVKFYSEPKTYFSYSKYAACAGGNCASCIAFYSLICGLSVIG